MNQKPVIAVLAVFAALGSWAFWKWVIDRGHAGPPTIAAEVTAVTDESFVQDDGYVDYVKAVNAWRGGDVTEADNACVDLFHVFGPYDGLDDDWLARWKLMSDQPEPVGPFFQSFYDFAGEGMPDELYEAWGKPWTDDEHPQLKGWIDANQVVMERLTGATSKTQYFYPLTVPEEDRGLLISALLELPQSSRGTARLLSMRAMNHLANDRVDKCLDDLVTTRKLARLISTRGTLVEHLVGIAIENIAADAEKAVIGSGKLTREQITDYLARVDERVAFNDLAESIDKAERYMGLSATQHMHRFGPHGLGMEPAGEVIPVSVAFDVDIAMRIMNQHYDMIMKWASADTYTAKQDGGREFENYMIDFELKQTSPMRIATAALGGRRTHGDFIGSIMASMLLPAINQLVDADTQREVVDRMSRLGFKLEDHRLRTGEFPDSLDELGLGVGNRLVIDPFTGVRFVYEKTGSGFRLYSLGSNRKDDGGLGWNDDNAPPRSDDWHFEVGG